MAKQVSSDSAGKPRDNRTSSRSALEGLVIEHVFSSADEHPFEQITWEKRAAHIGDDKGGSVFEQNDVEIPADWSQLATNVVASKYFYGEKGKAEREHSARQLVDRVTRTIADWGKQDGIFASDADAERFYRELTYLCINQYGSFNSPVWFNVGLFHQKGIAGSEGNFHWDAQANQPAVSKQGYEYPQCSACFIQSVSDTMEDIMRLARSEAMLFKFGSGTGTDFSTLRSSREKLSGGGKPSGPLSFMRVYDQIAAVVKSGGKTRRAAKMQSLRCDHPDIREFIEAKTVEEKKAWALIEAGYDGSLNGEAYASVMFQNANFSVRVTDDFMQAALDDAKWQTYAVTSGQPMGEHKARELLKLIAEGTHICGDPGVQYHTTINRWHTCPEGGEICASNPCSEYMFVNDSACNLASLNLMKFRKDDGTFDIERFRHAVRIFIIAQEILVDRGSYPNDRICRNSHDFRPLGLGYANLGALLMSLGLPYDSDSGRGYAAAVTALMTGTAYATSAELSSRLGGFPQYHRNRQHVLRVAKMHRAAVEGVSKDHCPSYLIAAAAAAWDEAYAAGEQSGFRNSQVTVLAPTGTIGFMMDCDTTGIEPDIALVKYKSLAGGGTFKIVNRTVPLALEKLGHTREQITEIVDYIDEHDTIEGSPHLSEKKLNVFDCAFKPAKGQRAIHYMGHIRMMGAVQPFLSGAISKTVNMPKDTTVDEIMNVYIEGWKLGLKAVAIYRDGSKRTQPLNVNKAVKAADAGKPAEPQTIIVRSPHRRRLPATRPAITHKFDVAGHEGYLNVGLFEDGTPGEIFVTMAKEGSTVGGMMDAFATALSLCLQYGVPLEGLVKKFSHQRFEPSGMTSNKDIPFAKSIIDYIFRWLGMTFLEDYRKENMPRRAETHGVVTPGSAIEAVKAVRSSPSAAPEAVKDDASSEPGRADQTSHTDVKRSVGAIFPPPATEIRRGELEQASAPAGIVKVAAAAIVPDEKTGRKTATRLERLDLQYAHFQEDAPPCGNCGAIMVRNGSCYLCRSCGTTSGCS
ncbi:MAG: vitamin B12-dependent ribonucleotide reductase [Planctomycetes bacterium]|nr:vitamin B12-dependent ribonucleotide reductase [Planctomycetota bacterium]